MEYFSILFRHSLFYGAILSAVATFVILGSLRWNPEIWLSDYPPDVRAKYGPPGEKTGRQKRWVSILFFLFLAGLLVLSIVRLGPAMGGEPPFLAVFLHTFIVFMIFNLVDLLVIDWLVLQTLQPPFAILPGTEGMAGYRDFSFPFFGFLKGSLGILVFSLAAAGVTSMLFMVL